jgi:pSer/pThr/pTyr-binding forkhead associated (FHA) protein
MVFFIEVLDGPLQGSRFKIEAGHIIGRNSGDIIIEDPKVSHKHAQFDLDNKGQFVLNDLNSSNGILTGNRRVRKLAMIPGVAFKLGRTSFQVIQIDDQPAQNFARILTWKENLAEKLPIDWVQNKMADGAGKPFSPCLRLEFIQGIQADESFILGYGPRKAGALSLDIELRDPEAPELAFEIIPDDGFAVIKNHCKNKLTLNNQRLKTETLQDGDLIRFGRSVIKVSYV